MRPKKGNLWTAWVKLKVRSSPPHQRLRRLRGLGTVKVLKIFPSPSRPPSGARKSTLSSSPGKLDSLLHVPRVNQTPPSSSNHPTATPPPPTILGPQALTMSPLVARPTAQQNNPLLREAPCRLRMMRRLRCPHSPIQRQISYLRCCGFHFKASFLLQRPIPHPEVQNPSPSVALDQRYQRRQHLEPITQSLRLRGARD